MGNGIFSFKKHLLQGMNVNGASAPAVHPEKVFNHMSHDFKQWHVADHVEASYGILMVGAPPLAMRVTEPLPPALVDACRAEIARLNWMNTIFPHTKERVVKRVNTLLDCEAVRLACTHALARAGEEIEEFRLHLENALEGTNADFHDFAKARQRVLAYL